MANGTSLDLQHVFAVLECAYTDIDGLLQAAFDTNAKDCTLEGVKETLDEIQSLLRLRAEEEDN